MNKLFLIVFLFVSKIQCAQFPGAVGTIGSTAIYKDSSIVIDWASSCKIIRGFQNSSNTSAGYATVGDSSSAIGKAGENGVVSLGDGGVAILTFTNAITNGLGFDFAVYENSFNDNFLELAFVEASSDGIHFFRFPATSNTDTTNQISSFDLLDPTKINNLAGKYRVNYGTPFNIDELPDTVLLNKNNITYIKIIDVVGSMNSMYGTRDAYGHKINDPFPTEFPSGGFDLDAVGVIHNQSTTNVNNTKQITEFQIFPNPTLNDFSIKIINNISYNLTLVNLLGDVLIEKNGIFNTENVSLSNLPKGIYTLLLQTENTLFSSKIIKQ